MDFQKLKKSAIYKLFKQLGIVAVALWMLERVDVVIRAIKSIIMSIRSEKLLVQYSKDAHTQIAKWKEAKYSGINTTPRTTPIIVSLTSYPARLPYIHIVIASLLQQTVKPDRIVLWLADDECPDRKIPSSYIEDLCELGLSIEWIPKSIKAFAKLLPSMQKYPDAMIVTVDDDKMYDATLIETLYEAHKKHKDCIIAHNAVYLEKTASGDELYNFFDLSNKFKSKMDNHEFRNHCAKPNHNIFVQGHFGVLYPPKCLPEVAFDDNLYSTLTPFADDIWFNAVAMLHGTKKCLLEHPLEPTSLSGKEVQRHALFRTNLLEHQNDAQLKRVFDYFDLYQYLD